MTPIDSYQQWGVILAVAIGYAFIPRLPFNDWELNTRGLVNGLTIYSDSNFVFPPWGLILLWPYRWLTIPGTQLASVLVIGWLAYRRRWNLILFGTIMLSPYFIWTMSLASADILFLLMPILLWETVEGKRWMTVGRCVALPLLLVKPQSGFLMVLYLAWKHRRPLKNILVPLAVVLLVVIPTSLMGSPPLVFQWIRNILLNPSSQNLEFWRINNVSITALIGWIPGVLFVAASLGGIYGLMRFFGRKWTEQHTQAVVFAAAMLVGRYASNQGMIVPLALVGSWPGVLLQYVVLFLSKQAGIDSVQSAWWALMLIIGALWFYKPVSDES